MSNINYVDQTKKPEDFPNEVHFCFTNEGELQQTANASTVTYIRADIVAGREAKLIEAAYDKGAYDQRGYDMPYIVYATDGNDTRIYGAAGLEKLK